MPTDLQHTHPLTDETTAAEIAACPRCAKLGREIEEWERAVVQLYGGVPFSAMSEEQKSRAMKQWRPVYRTRSVALHHVVQGWWDSGLAIEAYVAARGPIGTMAEAVQSGRVPQFPAELRPWVVPWQ